MAYFRHKDYITNYANKNIKKVLKEHRTEASLPENKLIELLGRFNLKDALISIAAVSRKIYLESDNIMDRPFFIREETTNVFINTTNLAKLTSYLFLSKANDYKREKIGDNIDANITALCGLISYHLKDPKHEIIFSNPANTIYILVAEQIKWQIPIYHYYARTHIIYNEILTSERFKERIKFENIQIPSDIDSIFLKMVGLSIDDYLKIGLMFILFFQNNNPSFNISDLNNVIMNNKNISINDISKFIDFMSTDYETFRKQGEHNIYLNPLNVSPIIKFQDSRNFSYVIPDINIFLEKIYNGLFYDFERFYQNKSIEELRKFRQFFGFLFEEYIGELIKYKFGEENVKGEIIYTKKSEFKFFDWVVELEDKFLLIEVKSLCLPQQDLYNKKIEEIVKDKLEKKLKKVYNKINDIEKCDELKNFRKKPIYPILLVKDVPLANSTIMKSIIKKINVEDNNFKEFLQDYKFIVTDLNDFESLIECFYDIQIEELFKEIEESFADGFIPILKKCSNRKDSLLHEMLTKKAEYELNKIAEAYKN